MARKPKYPLPQVTPPPPPAPQTWSEKRDDVVLQAIAWQRYREAFLAEAPTLTPRLREARGLQMHLAERALAGAVLAMLGHTEPGRPAK